MLHFIVMGAVVFGLIYAWLFTVSLWLCRVVAWSADLGICRPGSRSARRRD